MGEATSCLEQSNNLNRNGQVISATVASSCLGEDRLDMPWQLRFNI